MSIINCSRASIKQTKTLAQAKTKNGHVRIDTFNGLKKFDIIKDIVYVTTHAGLKYSFDYNIIAKEDRDGYLYCKETEVKLPRAQEMYATTWLHSKLGRWAISTCVTILPTILITFLMHNNSFNDK